MERAFELPALEAPAGAPTISGSGPATVPLVAPVDVAAEVEAARAAGHEQGFQAGFMEAQEQMAVAIAALQSAVAGVDAERERIASAVESATVELALRIAE